MRRPIGMLMGVRYLAGYAIRLLLTVLIAGLAGATVVRLAPAFGVTEAELDTRLSRESMDALRAENAAGGPVSFYVHYLSGAIHGDFGVSPSLGRPVSGLLRERLPVSAEILGWGLLAGAGAGFLSAIAGVMAPQAVMRLGPLAASSVFLSVPAAALALLCLIGGLAPWWALAALLFPRVYTHAATCLRRVEALPHILAARARGISQVRILFAHILPVAGPQLLSLLAMAVAIGFPALVPIEAITDTAGIGQLAWKAALSRDLPLLVALTMMASVVVLSGNAAADASAAVMRRHV